MKELDQPIIFSSLIDEDTEFIPLVGKEDEDKIENEELPDILPLLPLRNNVLFPGVVIPITVGRDKSIKLIQDAYKNNRIIGVVGQKDPNTEEPVFSDLNTTGTIAHIIKMLKMPDGSSTVIIQGKRKFRVKKLLEEMPYFKVSVEGIFDVKPDFSSPEFVALHSSLKDLSLKIIEQSPNIPSEASFAIKNIDSPNFLINFISSNMNVSVEEKQRLLEQTDVMKRAREVLKLLTQEYQLLELKNDIQSKVKTDIDQQQKEYFLHQQMRQIQEELGGNPQQQEIEELKLKAKKKKWSKKIQNIFEKELAKLERINPQGAEYGVQLNYLNVLIDLPWKKYSKDNFDLKRAKKILDADHYGLDKVKDRILEHLAVLKLKGDLKSPIICLYGPPGVGKTSLGKSIAKALGRKYVRMSLGGMRDEAEIRGHRRTYIGAMPGRVLQNLKKAKTSNPVFVLDEIDKVNRDFNGDPSSALLEVLDPEQNKAFNDNFVELDYDLSKVMFIATANNISTIQGPLRDRMEMIEVNGYTTEEKTEIAKRHLIPKQLKENGLKPEQVVFSDDVIRYIIDNYTRESGVRTLEKRIGKVQRNKAKAIAMEQDIDANVSIESLNKILGPAHEREIYENNDKAGVVTGLAWTQVGGEILFIETAISKGRGKLTLTGNLGDVMKESAVIALEYLKSKSDVHNIDSSIFDQYNIHVHVPEGATPKDGPSAGITMLTALASLVTQRKVKKNLAMTGEITLRGKVLPVGGIKEKILAAKRANIKQIILSKSNEKDVLDINQKYVKGLKFHYVDEMSEVLEIALLKEKVKNPKVFKIDSNQK